MNRRFFLKSSSAMLVTGALLGELASVSSLPAALSRPAKSKNDLLRHRFGLNYVPSRNWYFIYNDWNISAIARDFDRIVELGADHLRVMLVWPWFQPNPDR